MQSARGKYTGSTFSRLRPFSTHIPSSVSAMTNTHTSSVMFLSPSTASYWRGRARPWVNQSRSESARSWMNAIVRCTTNGVTEVPSEPSQPHESEKHEKVIIPASHLKPAFKPLQNRFVSLMNEILITSVTSPALASTWLYLTEQMLYQSPIAMALLLSGTAMVSKKILDIRRINYYSEFSIKIDEAMPSVCEHENARILPGPRQG